MEHAAIGAEGQQTLEGVEPVAGDLLRAGVKAEQPGDQEELKAADGPHLVGNPGVGEGAAGKQLSLETEKRGQEAGERGPGEAVVEESEPDGKEVEGEEEEIGRGEAIEAVHSGKGQGDGHCS